MEPFRPGGAVGAFLLVDPADGTTLAAGMVGDRPCRAARPPATADPTSDIRCSPAEDVTADPDSLPTPGP